MVEERIDIKELSDEEYNKYAYDTETFLFYAHEGLLRFGGSFAINLGKLLASADRENKLKIIRTWPNELTEHAKLFILWAKKHRPDLLISKESNHNESI